jgi:chemotaxis protein MotB
MSVRGFLALGAAGLLAMSGAGCVARHQVTAMESQLRVLVEQDRAKSAEIANLHNHSRNVEERARAAEERIAQLESEAGAGRRRISNYQHERDAIHQQLEGMARGSSRIPPGLSDRLVELSRQYPSLHYDESTGISKLDTDVLFDSGHAELKPEAQKLLREFARLFQEPGAQELKIMVVGHTDDRQMARRPARDLYPTNWHLSAARSLAVAEYLRKSGLPEERMGIAGFAQHQPITANENESERQRNRRVEIFVTGPETPVVGWVETTPSLY